METKKMNAYEAPEVELVNFEFEGTIAATTCSAVGEAGDACTEDEGLN